MSQDVRIAHKFFALIDPNWGEESIIYSTIRPTEQAAIEAAIREPTVGIYSGYCRHGNPALGLHSERLGTMQKLRAHGFDVRPISATIDRN